MSATSIFVSYATNDLDRSRAFYEALGYTINPMFSDDNTICIVVSDTIYFMVMRREFFTTFTDKAIPDTKTHGLSQSSLTLDRREAVDDIVARGLAAGGSEARPAQDLGFMYSRDIDDPDGNALSFLFMDPATVAAGPEAFMAEQGGAPPTRRARCRRLPLAARQPAWAWALQRRRQGARAGRRSVGSAHRSRPARRRSPLQRPEARTTSNPHEHLERPPARVARGRSAPTRSRRTRGYELTASGHALEAAVLALERWGWDSLGEPADGEIVTADSLSFTLRAAFRPEVARSMPPADYRLHVVATSRRRSTWRLASRCRHELGAPAVGVGRRGRRRARDACHRRRRHRPAGPRTPQPTEVLDVVVQRPGCTVSRDDPGRGACVRPGDDALLFKRVQRVVSICRSRNCRARFPVDRILDGVHPRERQGALQLPPIRRPSGEPAPSSGT